MSILVEIEGQVTIWYINHNFSATLGTIPELLPTLSEHRSTVRLDEEVVLTSILFVVQKKVMM